jgi:hypothetical protein
MLQRRQARKRISRTRVWISNDRNAWRLNRPASPALLSYFAGTSGMLFSEDVVYDVEGGGEKVLPFGQALARRVGNALEC